jgi:spermidine synthase
MAVLWKEQSGERILEVRSAGATRRLYSDGVLHTQYNPKHILTGDVWDPMGLAPAAAPVGGIQRALILGLGGGAVVHQLREFFRVPEITAVELDAKRIMLGRKYFGLNMPGVHLKHADAIEFVNKYKGPPFDLVIDDLFGESDGEPVRAAPLNARWLKRLHAMTAAQGVLVTNCVDWAELLQSPFMQSRMYRRRFAGAIHCMHETSWNHIAIFSRAGVDKDEFENRIQALPQLQTAKMRERLRFTTRALW